MACPSLLITGNRHDGGQRKGYKSISDHRYSIVLAFSFFKCFGFISLMCMCVFLSGCAHMHVRVSAGPQGGQTRTLVLLEWELQAAVSHLTWVRGVDLGSLKAFLTTEPSL